MTLIDAVNKLTAPLRSKVANMIARAVLKAADDSKKMQLLQLEAGALGEVRADVEHVQPYGFTAVPLEGAEAVVVFPGGRRDHPLAVAVADRRYRIKDLANGEVCVYDHTGTTILLKSNGDVVITPSSGKASIVADVKITGKLEVTEDVTLDKKIAVTGVGTFSDDVNVTKTLTATTDVVGGGKHLKTHTHLITPGADTNPVSGGDTIVPFQSAAPT